MDVINYNHMSISDNNYLFISSSDPDDEAKTCDETSINGVSTWRNLLISSVHQAEAHFSKCIYLI